MVVHLSCSVLLDSMRFRLKGNLGINGLSNLMSRSHLEVTDLACGDITAVMPGLDLSHDIFTKGVRTGRLLQ